MVQYEVSRKELLDKQQRKIDELERRAKALEKQKAENEAAWIEKQREFELTKVCALTVKNCQSSRAMGMKMYTTVNLAM